MEDFITIIIPLGMSIAFCGLIVLFMFIFIFFSNKIDEKKEKKNHLIHSQYYKDYGLYDNERKELNEKRKMIDQIKNKIDLLTKELNYIPSYKNEPITTEIEKLREDYFELYNHCEKESDRLYKKFKELEKYRINNNL